MKKACQTRWLSLGAGVEAAFNEYEGIVNSLRKIQKTIRNQAPLQQDF